TVTQDYNLSPAKPTLVAETAYETGYGDPNNTAYYVRQNEYQALLAGALGVTYGDYKVQDMDISWSPSDWLPRMYLPGVQQMTYMRNLLASRAWYNLVPDQAHTVLTAGYGNTDYASAELSSDDSFFLAYIPTARTVTVDLTKLAGSQVKAQWY